MDNLQTESNIEEHLQFLKTRFNLELRVIDKEEGGRRQTHTPLGPIKEYQFIKKDEIIAHHRFVPVFLSHDGEKKMGLRSSNSWVSKSYRGFGLLPTLIGKGLADFKKKGFQFFLAFPNQNSFSVIKDSCGMMHLGTCTYLVKPSHIKGILKRMNIRLPSFLTRSFQGLIKVLNYFFRLQNFNIKNKYRIEFIENIPHDIDSLIDKSISKYKNYLIRNKEYLSWQYGHADYVKIACYDSEENLVGFLIGRQDIKDGLGVAAILDYYIDPLAVRGKILKKLVFAFEGYYKDCDIFSVLMNPHHDYKYSFNFLGYVTLNTECFGRSFWFMFKLLTDDKQDFSFNTWHLSFYDSIDAF